MDSIYHEKQQGQLCAQHCLNNLLQGPYFTAVDLSEFAHELDEAEKVRMAEGGFTSDFYKFVEQPSSNMDDSGYFSIQVITKAISVWNLEIVTLSSPAMKHAMEDPTTQNAFICNHDYHWLTVRKLGRQWFNLDSLLKVPKLVSDTYLSLFLTQLQMEGYSIFVVVGRLPTCEADELLALIPVDPPPPSPPPKPSERSKRGKPTKWSRPATRGRPAKNRRSDFSSSEEEEGYALQLATAMSVSMARDKVGGGEGGERRKRAVEGKEGASYSDEDCYVVEKSKGRERSSSEGKDRKGDGDRVRGEGGRPKEENSIDDDMVLAVAIAASLDDQEWLDQTGADDSKPTSEEELRQRRLLRFGQIPHGE